MHKGIEYYVYYIFSLSKDYDKDYKQRYNQIIIQHYKYYGILYSKFLFSKNQSLISFIVPVHKESAWISEQ